MTARGTISYENGRSWRSYRALPPTTFSDYASTDESLYPQESCSPWIRYAIFGCNIIFLVVGVSTLAMGAWLRTDSRFRDFLSERYRNAVEEAFWQAPTLYTFSYILIVLGASMIVVSMFGCCGAVSRSKVLLVVYVVGIALLMLCTLSAGIYILYKKDGIDVEVADALTYMVQHYYQGAGIVQESLDRLQQTFRCCGNAGCGDFRVFRQDPPRSCDIRCDGCHYRIMLALRIGFSVAVVLFSVVIIAQLLTIALALTTIMRTSEPETNLQKRKLHRSFDSGWHRRPTSRQQNCLPDPRAVHSDFIRRHDGSNSESSLKTYQRY